MLREDEREREITDKKEIAKTFNKFFMEKIEDLKDNLGKSKIKDLTKKLKKLKKKNLNLP